MATATTLPVPALPVYTSIAQTINNIDAHKAKAAQDRFHARIAPIVASALAGVALIACHMLFHWTVTTTFFAAAVISTIAIHYLFPKFGIPLIKNLEKSAEQNDQCVEQGTAIKIKKDALLQKTLQEHMEACDAILVPEGLRFEIAALAAKFNRGTDAHSKPTDRNSPIGNVLATLLANHEVALESYEKAVKLLQEKAKAYTTIQADDKKTTQDKDLALDAVFKAHLEVYNAITALLVAKAFIARPTFSGKIEDVLTFPQAEPLAKLAMTIYNQGWFTLCHIKESQAKERILVACLGSFEQLTAAQLTPGIPFRNTCSSLSRQDNPRGSVVAVVAAIDAFEVKKAQAQASTAASQ